MQKFIPLEKMSKKEKRKIAQSKRQTWAIDPVSRRSKNKKKYDRKNARWHDDQSGVLIRH